MYLQKQKTENTIQSLLKDLEDLFIPTKLFKDSFYDKNWDGNYINLDNNTAKINIVDKEKEILINVPTPGYSKKDLSIEIKSNILSITGKKASSAPDEKYQHQEYKFSDFKRNLKLGETLDLDSAKVNYKDGLLTISFDKKESDAPKSLKIN